MATYIAFLRAINLGAKRQFPKEAIRAAVESAGFTGVETYINTGNVRLETAMRSRAKIESALEQAFAADRGFDVPTVVFAAAELKAAVLEADRLAADRPALAGHYVTLLKNEPTPQVISDIEKAAIGDESVVIVGRAVHLMIGKPYNEVVFSNAKLERSLGVATTRNATVLRALAAKWC